RLRRRPGLLRSCDLAFSGERRTELYGPEHAHDALRRVPVSVRVRHAGEPLAEARGQHGLDAGEDLVALRADVDDVAGTQPTRLPRAHVDDGKLERGRLDEPARRVADHRVGLAQEREIHVVAEGLRQPDAWVPPGELLEAGAH